MNDKYKDLYDKAVKHCVDNSASGAWGWEKKYAELIIRECIDACEDPWSKSAGVAQSAIKQHFGLE